jgi:hypothetical protein
MRVAFLFSAAAVLVAGTQAVFFAPRKTAKPEILSAEFAVNGAALPLCAGTNDLLPVTFTFPVSGEPQPEDFAVIVGTKTGAETERVTPTCATLAPAAEPNERRTVLLLGSFKPSDSLGPIGVTGRCGQLYAHIN